MSSSFVRKLVVVTSTLALHALCAGCASSGDDTGAGGAAVNLEKPAPAAPPNANGATASNGTPKTGSKDSNPTPAATTAASLEGDWGRSSMAEGPDGPVSISFRDGRYTAKLRDGQLDSGGEGPFRFFANEKDAAAIVSFVGEVPALPAGTYVLLELAEDASDLHRVSVSADGKSITFEPAARQRGQGLHATGELGTAVTLQKDFNH